jgi:acylphosphatase
MPHASLHAIIHGRVQGVFFRASTRSEAERLGLRGWIRNLPDGTVEIHAVGSRDALESLHVWLQEGPPPAEVDLVEVEWGAPAEPLPGGFTVTG